MIQSTTPTIEGKKIQEYHGVVTGEAILGANIFKDIFASIRDIVGGRSAAYERELQKAREIALLNLAPTVRPTSAYSRADCGRRSPGPGFRWLRLAGTSPAAT